MWVAMLVLKARPKLLAVGKSGNLMKQLKFVLILLLVMMLCLLLMLWKV